MLNVLIWLHWCCLSVFMLFLWWPVGGTGYWWCSWHWSWIFASFPANNETTRGGQEISTAVPIPFQILCHVHCKCRGGTLVCFHCPYQFYSAMIMRLFCFYHYFEWVFIFISSVLIFVYGLVSNFVVFLSFLLVPVCFLLVFPSQWTYSITLNIHLFP